jgi:cobalamin biosynthesis protein CbiG
LPDGLAVGIGIVSYAEPQLVVESLAGTLAEAGLAGRPVVRIGTIDKLASHPALLAAAEATGARLTGYPPEALDRVAVPTPSDYVAGVMRTKSVSEAAALLAAGPGARLLVPKRVHAASVTVAVAAVDGAA